MTETIRYLRVKTMIHKITSDAVLIHKQHAYSEWIPLSLLHTLDERTISSGSVKRGDTMTLRIVDWKVRALGLPTEPKT